MRCEPARVAEVILCDPSKMARLSHSLPSGPQVRTSAHQRSTGTETVRLLAAYASGPHEPTSALAATPREQAHADDRYMGRRRCFGSQPCCCGDIPCGDTSCPGVSRAEILIVTAAADGRSQAGRQRRRSSCSAARCSGNTASFWPAWWSARSWRVGRSASGPPIGRAAKPNRGCWSRRQRVRPNGSSSSSPRLRPRLAGRRTCGGRCNPPSSVAWTRYGCCARCRRSPSCGSPTHSGASRSWSRGCRSSSLGPGRICPATRSSRRQSRAGCLMAQSTFGAAPSPT